MILTILFIVICAVALYTRETPSLIFASLMVIHDLVSVSLDGWLYYLSAGAESLLIICIMSLFVKPSNLTNNIMYLSFASIVLNLYGFIIWALYLPPTSYDMGFIVLYAISIYVLLRGNGERIGRNNLFHHNNNKGVLCDGSTSSEARG